MAAQCAPETCDEVTNSLLEFMKSSSPKTMKLPPQASLTSKEEKKAYMLNRVQQARFERELVNLAIEKKFNNLTAIYGAKVMTRKQGALEKCKERVAKENAQRRNLEDIQRLAEEFFEEERRQYSIAYVDSRYNMNFLEAMTSSKLNQLLQTTLPEAIIDKMLGQEKVRQQRRVLMPPQANVKNERKPRTLFELIQLLKERGQIRSQSVQESLKETTFARISERSRQLSERSRARWKKAFALIINEHKEAKKLSREASHSNVDINQSATRRAITCPHKIRHDTTTPQPHSGKFPNRLSGRRTRPPSMMRLVSTRPVSATETQARITGLLAQEKHKQQQVQIQINKYFQSIEGPQ